MRYPIDLCKPLSYAEWKTLTVLAAAEDPEHMLDIWVGTHYRVKENLETRNLVECRRHSDRPFGNPYSICLTAPARVLIAAEFLSATVLVNGVDAISKSTGIGKDALNHLISLIRRNGSGYRGQYDFPLERPDADGVKAVVSEFHAETKGSLW